MMVRRTRATITFEELHPGDRGVTEAAIVVALFAGLVPYTQPYHQLLNLVPAYHDLDDAETVDAVRAAIALLDKELG